MYEPKTVYTLSQFLNLGGRDGKPNDLMFVDYLVRTGKAELVVRNGKTCVRTA